jgi:hypothetical protein
MHIYLGKVLSCKKWVLHGELLQQFLRWNGGRGDGTASPWCGKGRGQPSTSAQLHPSTSERPMAVYVMAAQPDGRRCHLRRTKEGDDSHRWAILGWSGLLWLDCSWASFSENKREWSGLLQGFWAELTMGCRNKVFEFSQSFWVQNQRFQTHSNQIWTGAKVKDLNKFLEIFQF